MSYGVGVRVGVGVGVAALATLSNAPPETTINNLLSESGYDLVQENTSFILLEQ